MNDAVDKALASSATYQRLMSEMQEETVKDLASAIKPMVDALRDVATRLSALTVAQRESATAVNDALLKATRENGKLMAEMREMLPQLKADPVKIPKLDLGPLAEAVTRHAKQAATAHTETLASLASLEAAVMADAKLVTGANGRPAGVSKVKK